MLTLITLIFVILEDDSIQIDYVNLMMYLIDKKFKSDGQTKFKGKRFCEQLLNDEAEGMAGIFFADVRKVDYPILECLCYLKHSLGYLDPDTIFEMVTKALRDSDNAGYIDIYSKGNLKKIVDSLGKV